MALRVGIAGLRFGMIWAKLFAACPDAELIAVCDAEEQKLALAKESLPSTVRVADFEALLDMRELDAVGIFTPAPLHADQAVRAIRARKHVLSAVPAAVTEEESRDLANAVSGSDRIYMMAENWVYEPSVVRARQLHQQGQLGELFYAEAEYIHALDNLRHSADGRPTWRNSLQPLLYPTHGTAPYLHMTGDRFTAVTAIGASGVRGPDDDYQADWVQSALFKCASGAAFRLTNSFRNVHGMSHFLSFYGDRGSVETGRFRDARTVCHISLAGSETVTREVCSHPPSSLDGKMGGGQGGHVGTSLQIVRDFVKSVSDGVPVPVDLTLALHATLAGIAGLKAVGSGQWEDVPDPTEWLI